MQVKKLLTDDDAVSPVIGVILMVAITVILAAVIAAFVLGLGGEQESAPQVTFEYDLDEGDASAATPVKPSIEVSHTSGDGFDPSNIQVNLEVGGTETTSDSETVADLTGSSWTEGDEISAGDSFTLDGGSVGGSWDQSDSAANDVVLEFVYAPGGDAQSVFADNDWSNTETTGSSP